MGPTKNCLRLGALLTAAAFVLCGGPALAQSTAADFVKSAGNPQPLESALAGVGVSGADLFNGEFTYEVPIPLPKFRGVDPKLALSFHSGGKNGPLGPGWSVSGFSTIQRVGVNHKTPDLLASGSTDIYLLDGAELMPCRATNGTSTTTGLVADVTLSPSCNNSGTHATKLESYKRIKFDGTNGTNGTSWTVTERDGTVATYEPLNTLRTLWGRKTLASSRGTVTYAWDICESDPAAGNCYPSGLSYGATTVKLSASRRGDHGTSFANGTTTLGEGTYLYRSVEVRIDKLPSAAYDLTYENTDATTGTSLLSSVQRYGKDYGIGSTGQVTSGSALPKTTFKYTGLPASPMVSVAVGGTWTYAGNDTIVLGDFNGDGRQDFIIQNNFEIALFAATGSATAPFAMRRLFASGDATYGAWSPGARGRDKLTVGDFDGDGKSDLLIVAADASKATLFYGVAGAAAAPFSNSSRNLKLWPSASADFGGWTPTVGDTYIAADFDGDGAADLLITDSRPQLPNAWVFWGGATPFSSAATRLWGSPPDGTYLGWTLRNLYSNVMGSSPPCTIDSDNQTTAIQLGDFNGDGKMDLVLTGDRSTCAGGRPVGSSCSSCSPQPPSRKFAIFTATGSRSDPFGKVPLSWTTEGITPYAPYVTVGDFNGDGKTDLLTMDAGLPGRGIVARMSTGGVLAASGAGFTATNLSNMCGSGPKSWCFTVPGTTFSYSDSIVLGDFDGDGSTDLLVYNNAPNYAGSRVGVIMGGGNPAAGMFSSATPASAFPLPAFVGQDGVLVGDFNGDGRSDILDRAAWKALLSQGPKPMLLSHIDNGSGGTVDVAYTPSSQWKNDNLDFVTQTASSVTTSAGHTAFKPDGVTGPTAARTSYAYEGGLWDPIERRFLGFRKVSEAQPCVGTTCPYRDTWYLQNLNGAYSKVQQLDVGALGSGGSRTLYSRHWFQYATGATTANGNVPVGPPYMSQLESEGIEEYDGTGATCPTWPDSPCANGQQVRRSYQYDNLGADRKYKAGFGNTTAVFDYGGSGVTGDETTTVTAFYPNTTDYLVSYPARTTVSGPGGTLSDTQTLYDGATLYTAPPSKGWATSTRRWLDRPKSRMVEATFEYDTAGNLKDAWDENHDKSAWEKDNASPAGAHTAYTYDTTYSLYLTSVTNPAGHETKYGWDKQCDKVATVSDPNNQTLTTTYDNHCRPSTVDRPSVGSPAGTGTTTFLYCNDPLIPKSVCGTVNGPNAQYVRTEGPSADGNGVQWTEDYYDGAGRRYRTRSKGPDSSHPSVVDFAFDALGKQAWSSRPYYPGDTVRWTSSTFDVLGRTQAVVLPDGAGTTASYDFATCADPEASATCARVTAADPLGHPTTTLRNARGHVVSVADNRGTTSYTSDLLGKLTSITDAAGNSWAYTPDSLGRNVAISDPDLGTWSYEYDDVGNLLKQTDAKGQITHVEYDALNRKKHRYSDTSAQEYAFWNYDQPGEAGTHYNKGRLTSIADGSAAGWSGLQTFNYDARGRLAKWERNVTGTSSTDFTVTNTYDDGDRPLGGTYTATVSGVQLESFSVGPITYDGAARPKALPGLVSSATYDAAGQLLTRANAIPNGTTLTNTYSPERGWIATRLVTGPGNSAIQSADYTSRDAEGKLHRFTNALTGATWLYTYDAADRMYFAQTSCAAQPKSAFYVYDNVDNITDRYFLTGGQYRSDHYVYGSPQHPHAVTAVGAASYAYDANGSMTSAPVYSPDASGAITPSGLQTIGYDVLNRMVAMGGNTYAYDADGTRVVENRRVFANDDFFVTDGSSVALYVYFGGERIAKMVSGANGTTAMAWLHTDHLGSIVNESDSTGSTAPYGGEQDYFPFGTPVTAGKPETFGFTGQHQNTTNGIVYLHARYYDPYIGRFMAADTASPTKFGVGVNRYAYALNNPVRYVDPTGTEAGDDAGIAEIQRDRVFQARNVAQGMEEQVKPVAEAGLQLTMVGGAVVAVTGKRLTGGEASTLERGLGALPLAVAVAKGAAAAKAGWVARSEAMSARAAAYQAEVTGAEIGQVYLKNGVKFDGVLDGVLLEAKGPGYRTFVDRVGDFFGWFRGRDAMVAQAERQLEAAAGQPIRWYVAEDKTANAISRLFEKENIKGIEVVFKPPGGI